MWYSVTRYTWSPQLYLLVRVVVVITECTSFSYRCSSKCESFVFSLSYSVYVKSSFIFFIVRKVGLGVINLDLSQQHNQLPNKLCEVPQLSVWWLGRIEPSLDFQAGEFSFNLSIMSSLHVSQQKSIQCFLTLLLLFFLVWLFYVQKWNMSKDNLYGNPVGKLQRCIKFSKWKW